MQEQVKGEVFLESVEKLANEVQYTPQRLTIPFPSALAPEGNNFEVFLFVNYDICNFTRFKRNNKDWPKFLEKFVYAGVNCSSTEMSMQFWKFNGDSLTYRKRIQSIDEICTFISTSYYQLKSFQQILNQDEHYSEKIYIKGCVWISGFKNGNIKTEYVANNISFQKQQFGQEFVGENIDEGFRLISCAKSSNLVIDPKIVYMLSLYKQALEDQEVICPTAFGEDEFKTFLDQKINVMKVEEAKRARGALDKIINNIFLMEFQHCKGVWNDRAYPVFWYISDTIDKEFVYDDVVDGKVLFAHRIHKCGDYEKEFEKSRNEVTEICAQVGVVDSIRSLLMNLNFFPDSAISGEYIFDMAKIYYMVACVLVSNGQKNGVLILKRSKNRHHLKDVWDLIPVKHARVKTKNNKSFVEAYMKKMLMQELSIEGLVDKDNVIFDIDKKRNSVKPWSLCNIYRNGEVHNGILCVAYIDIGNIDENKFIDNVKEKLLTRDGKYSDLKLVKYEDVNECNENDECDYFSLDDIKIRTLTLQEISDNSDKVLYDYTHISNFETKRDENQYSISYLGYSIKQILEGNIIDHDRQN